MLTDFRNFSIVEFIKTMGNVTVSLLQIS